MTVIFRQNLPWDSLIRSGRAASAAMSRSTPPIRLLQLAARSRAQNAADKPGFKSILDQEARLVSAEKKRNPGLYLLSISSSLPKLFEPDLTNLLVLMPITAFLLGSWQVKRLEWKTDLITKFEDRILRPPLPLPPTIDPAAVKDFDYRRIYVEGEFRYDQEMLIGPRIHDGKDGFLVVTPLERKGGSKVLVNRGWITRGKEKQRDRPQGVKRGKVVVQGLLREPFKKNIFTPDNKPEDGKWYFPDVKQMAEVSGSSPVWIEETMGKKVFQ